MRNQYDLLVALHHHTQRNGTGFIPSGSQIFDIAIAAGAVPGDRLAVTRWTGLLVDAQLLAHGLLSRGDARPLPAGYMWGSDELYRVGDFRITSAGLAAVDAHRREQRESDTDAALGQRFPHLARAWMNTDELRAIETPVGALRTALDRKHNADAIGAAKNLVEAACKIVLDRRRSKWSRRDSLPKLFRLALESQGDADNHGDNLGRSLASVVQRLAELRNAAGAGHGHGQSGLAEIRDREARLAASAGVSVAEFLLANVVLSPTRPA